MMCSLFKNRDDNDKLTFKAAPPLKYRLDVQMIWFCFCEQGQDNIGIKD